MTPSRSALAQRCQTGGAMRGTSCSSGSQIWSCSTKRQAWVCSRHKKQIQTGNDEFPNVNSPISGIVTASRQQPAQQPLNRKQQQQQPYAQAPSAAVRHTGPAGGKLPALSGAPKPQTPLPASAPESQLARPSAPAPSSGFPSEEADLLGSDMKTAHSAQQPSSVLSHIVQRPGSQDSAAHAQALLKARYTQSYVVRQMSL